MAKKAQKTMPYPKVDPERDEHHPFGGSGHWRLTQCAGSFGLLVDLKDEGLVPEDDETEARVEGNLGHRATAEDLLEHDRDLLAPELEELVQQCVARHFEDRASLPEGGTLEVENKLTLFQSNGEPMTFSTIDSLYHVHKKAIMHEWKFGHAELVPDEVARQTDVYAVAVLQNRPAIEEVRIVVFNPRTGEWFDDSRTRKDLPGLVKDLEKANRAALKVHAKRTPGEHCKYCKAKPYCPEVQEEARALAERIPTIPADPKVGGEMLDKVKRAIKALKAWESDYSAKAKRGDVPCPEGYEVVQRFGDYKITNPSDLLKLINAHLAEEWERESHDEDEECPKISASEFLSLGSWPIGKVAKAAGVSDDKLKDIAPMAFTRGAPYQVLQRARRHS